VYKLNPPAMFAHRRVLDNPLAVARMERMVAGFGRRPEDVVIIDETQMDLVNEAAGTTDEVATDEIVRGGHGRFRQGWMKEIPEPVFVFSTFVWNEDQRVKPTQKYRHPMAQRCYRLLCGQGRDFLYSRRPLLHGEFPGGYVCQGGDGLHTLCGCVHKCKYCGDGYIFTVQLDLENVCDDLRRKFVEDDHMKLYRWDMYSDTIPLEPEYGGTEVIGGCFNESTDKHLLLYSKSDNFDHLFEFDYQQHVLSNWTLSTETACRDIEVGAPSLKDRIAAMKRCQEHGYTVRAGFTPIIPVKNWRQEATDMIEYLYSQVEPEVLRLWVVSMMEAYELNAMFGPEMLDEHCLRRALEAAPEMDGTHHAPFPIDVRTDIYGWYLDEIRRVAPQTPVALCTEAPEAWRILQPKLAMLPNKMFCCCGGASTPGAWRKTA